LVAGESTRSRSFVIMAFSGLAEVLARRVVEVCCNLIRWTRLRQPGLNSDAKNSSNATACSGKPMRSQIRIFPHTCEGVREEQVSFPNGLVSILFFGIPIASAMLSRLYMAAR
jgi:hypothetical protein